MPAMMPDRVGLHLSIFAVAAVGVLAFLCGPGLTRSTPCYLAWVSSCSADFFVSTASFFPTASSV